MFQTEDQFLKNIAKPDFTWKFNLIGRKTIVGNVVDFLWTDQGVPVTLAIQPIDGDDVVEIPWTSIQHITIAKE